MGVRGDTYDSGFFALSEKWEELKRHTEVGVEIEGQGLFMPFSGGLTFGKERTRIVNKHIDNW